MLERYPEMAGLARLPSGTVLDGEIVVLDGGKPSFQRLMQREHLREPKQVEMAARRLPATYIAFDQLYAGGRSIMSRPLVERKERLAQLVGALADPHVILSEHVVGPGRAYFERVAALGLEGILAKRLASTYQPGRRSADWQKIKVSQTAELDVIGYVLQEGGSALGSLVLGERDGKRWVYRGKVGTGFSEAGRGEWLAGLAAPPERAPPPRDGPRDAHWRATGRRCRGRFLEWSPDGRLRGPSFKGWL